MIRNLLFISLLLAAAPAITAEPEARSLTDEESRNLETMRLWGTEVWGNGRLELVPELVGAQYVRHGAKGTRVVTPASYSEEIATARSRDIVFTVEESAIDGNHMWTRWSMTGRQPNGNAVTAKGLQLYRFEEGKLVETWNLFAPGVAWE